MARIELGPTEVLASPKAGPHVRVPCLVRPDGSGYGIGVSRRVELHVSGSAELPVLLRGHARRADGRV